MSDDARMPEPPGPEQPGSVSDAPPGNWVDRFAPPATRPYLRLSRADRPIGTWLLLIPCLWGLALAAQTTGFRPWDAWIAIGCGIGAFLMRGAGCTWNDISDRDIDALVERTRSRPLPSGQVTTRQALIWMVAQALLAAIILFSYTELSIKLGLASLLLVAIYPFAKRFTWWPQVFLGLAFNWGALLAYAAHGAELSVAVCLLYAAGICWTLFYDTIYAHQDRDDDALIGVKSTARLFGSNTRTWLLGFQIATLTLMLLAALLALPPHAPFAKLGLVILGIWAFGWHMTWQLRQLDIDDPASCRRIFLSNRDAGMIPALFLAAAAVV